jgi:hypothetical protein
MNRGEFPTLLGEHRAELRASCDGYAKELVTRARTPLDGSALWMVKLSE